MILLLLIFSFVYANSLTACYDAKYLFFTVAKTCITYKIEDKTLEVSSFAKTVGVGGWVKRVYNTGSARISLKDLRPLKFEYHQEEGTFKRDQFYTFNNNNILVKKIHYVGLSNQVERSEEKVYPYKGYVDPYTAALILYRDSQRKDRGSVFMFYDDREYVIPYSVLAVEWVETPAGRFYSRLLEVYPNVETKGLLKPKGRWYLWIDQETLLPVQMELGFILGSVKVYLTSLQGDKYLLREVFTYHR
ncbi:DUF3108 domain-containing protein [Thermocrinis minervae]|uniref:DUF3108 domain-containing protein n=1 Tax=Thermocrinis minervae TaxID=381751 RepID=A0A1M6SM68_9AQUI|nr:DUF3108 domain-containing protein [Thermocrinis minervae]SHK45736.1 Protein of unknown function [Thermocrinis minervae]